MSKEQTEEYKKKKPLLAKAYGSIPHLPTSRLGDGDRYITFGQADILTHKARDKHDYFYVMEKLDGSCMSVANVDGELKCISRYGYLAEDGYEMMKYFKVWVDQNISKFQFLKPGERIVGEWLSMAHGTIYELGERSPYAVFDIFREGGRIPYSEFLDICEQHSLTTAPMIYQGPEPLPVETCLTLLGEFGRYGAKEPAEGLVYRVDRRGKFDFIAKFVQHGKVDGKYFDPHPIIWHWRPTEQI